jgi:cytidylate kinase
MSASFLALCVTGPPAAGKSTVVTALGKELNLYTFHSGKVLRTIASESTDATLRHEIELLMARANQCLSTCIARS